MFGYYFISKTIVESKMNTELKFKSVGLINNKPSIIFYENIAVKIGKTEFDFKINVYGQRIPFGEIHKGIKIGDKITWIEF
jgi:hypothetical protein